MKRLVITGASGGLGAALKTTFSDAGWEIGAPNRNELDVRNLMAIENYFKSRQIDLLVCAAGVIWDVPLVSMSENQWDEVFTVNYEAVNNCTKVVLPEMIRQGHGHVIFISSYSALHPAIGQAAYAASKAALLGLTADLAIKHGSSNIRFNAILPGFLETRMTEKVGKQRKIEILADHTLGRFNTAITVARFIRYLHDNLLSTSGQVFQLDSRIS